MKHANPTRSSNLVDRYGRTGFALYTSPMWALPMAAWAGTADLTPIDQTATPWIALSVGLVMLAVWLVMLTQLGRIPVSKRQRRLDLSQMSSSEKRWTLALAAFITGLIAWLNGAATVDWTPLVSAVKSGRIGAILFGAALAAFLIAMLAGIAFSWRKGRAAFDDRKARAAAAAEPV